MSWFEPIVRELRLHAEHALLRRLDAGAGFADPRIASQIYLRDPAANARIAGGTLRPHGTHHKALAELGAASRHARAQIAGTRLGTLLERHALDEIAGGVSALALAYAIDLDTRELVHALAGARRAPGLYVDTCADVLEIPAEVLVPAIALGSPLRRSRAVVLDGDSLDAELELAGGALAWLLGDEALQPPLAGTCELIAADAELGVVLPESTRSALDALAPHGASPTSAGRSTIDIAITLRGPRGSGRRAAAHRIARAFGRPLLVVPIPALLAAEKRGQRGLLGPALAAARLRDAVPYLAEADAMYDEGGNIAADHAEAISHAGSLIVVGTTGRGGHLELLRPQLVVAIGRADLDDRARAWRAALPPAQAETASELAARYVIGPGAIADVAAEAARYADAARTSLDAAALEAAVARRLSLRLGTYGAVVSRKARMAELVLPDDVIDTLRDMIAMVRERAQILERWGYQRHLGISRGVAALYSGEPGTGKTMAASVVASELGLELVRIDLSAVVSKYVGETEKNLAKIFDEAQDAHAMLLFDEADSLFGKRTELKSAQDRFANLEVNYILQRMETFDGVSVLTTNAESAIDPALQRRLNFRIRFPEPEADERARLWKQLLPPSAGLGDLDFVPLAERFDMTGGYIKNAVVRAAVIAARAGRAIIADDLWTGAHHEYVEMGKVMPSLPPRGAS
ncbi:MAG TPA: ATP-binding protein [Kofleriaceae bacterium]|nr:ATP-binding protein [Kofleriaceae bacterium]